MTLRLESNRLILRPFEDRDAEPFSAYRSDPDVARYQGWDAPYSLEKAAVFIALMKAAVPGTPGEWFQLAAELKSSDVMIGDCAFHIKENGGQAEIAFTLARAYQGQGYATETARRLLDYLFADLKMHRVFANIDPENRASAHVLERVGMRHEGRFIQSLWFKGRWADEDWYAILMEDWETQVQTRNQRR